MSTPDPNQQPEALKRANEVRAFRSNLKKDLKSGKIKLKSVLLNPPEEIKTMKIDVLLLAIPRLGPYKVDKLLTKYRLSPRNTINHMSEQRREELLRGVNKQLKSR